VNPRRLLLGSLLGLVLLGSGGCSSDDEGDPFRRVVADAETVFVLHSGGGLIERVSRPREIDRQPTVADFGGAEIEGGGALVEGALWVGDFAGIGPMTPEGFGEPFVTVETLVGVPEGSSPFVSITSVVAYGPFVWLGVSPVVIDDALTSGPTVDGLENLLLQVDTRTGEVRQRLILESPVIDAVAASDRLVVLTGDTFAGRGGDMEIQIRSADTGNLLARNDSGLGAIGEFDRLSRGGPDVWLTTGAAELVSRINLETGRRDRVLSVPCAPEVVLAEAQGLIVPCADRPSLLLQRREGGPANELPIEDEATDLASAAEALWVIQRDGKLTRTQLSGLPWPRRRN
jgi:hypothetical protein